MDAFEYLLLFTAIILGLAVVDLILSLHRLLSAGSRVKWDWLAPLAAFVAFLKIVSQWWTWHSAQGLARGLTFEMFLLIVASTVFLSLLAMGSLPDEQDEGEIDLAAHFAAARRRWWIFYAGHWALGMSSSIWAQMQIEGARFTPLTFVAPAFLLGVVAIAMVFVRNRWINGVVLALLAALYLTQFAGATLS